MFVSVCVYVSVFVRAFVCVNLRGRYLFILFYFCDFVFEFVSGCVGFYVCVFGCVILCIALFSRCVLVSVCLCVGFFMFSYLRMCLRRSPCVFTSGCLFVEVAEGV